jgi:hypothetical protein
MFGHRRLALPRISSVPPVCTLCNTMVSFKSFHPLSNALGSDTVQALFILEIVKHPYNGITLVLKWFSISDICCSSSGDEVRSINGLF